MIKDTETTSLYIHVPFCLKKCPYCDFYSVPVSSGNIDSYAELLVQHLQFLVKQDAPKQLETIFFGGGTPSLLPPEDVGRILNAAERIFGFSDDLEISLEANPGTVDAETLAGFKAAGINRLSIGVQSLCDHQLQKLERPHSASEAEEAIRLARSAGFKNISADLMFALPGQNLDNLRNDVERLLQHDTEHLAIYGLTFEAGTPLYDRLEAGEVDEADEELYVEGYRLLDDLMITAGYRHYEISNFARPGYECRHNQRYWRRQENLAIGAGAHSFVSHGWGERWAIPDDIGSYAADLAAGRDPARLLEGFDKAGAMFETLYLGLRTADGVDGDLFRKRYGAGLETVYADAVSHCGDLLEQHNGSYRLTLEGWLLFNTLLAHFP